MGIEGFFSSFFRKEPERTGESLKVRALTVEHVRMGSGSLAERLQAEQREGRCSKLDEHIAQAPEFAVRETRPTVDIVLVNFPKGMKIEAVWQWLTTNPKYAEYELATPEHLVALNSDSRLLEMTKEELGRLRIVALGASTLVKGLPSTPVKGEPHVAELHIYRDGTRDLGLRWAGFTWENDYWFLLVRKKDGT